LCCSVISGHCRTHGSPSYREAAAPSIHAAARHWLKEGAAEGAAAPDAQAEERLWGISGVWGLGP
jgi:hypothetical protein